MKGYCSTWTTKKFRRKMFMASVFVSEIYNQFCTLVVQYARVQTLKFIPSRDADDNPTRDGSYARIFQIASPRSWLAFRLTRRFKSLRTGSFLSPLSAITRNESVRMQNSRRLFSGSSQYQTNTLFRYLLQYIYSCYKFRAEALNIHCRVILLSNSFEI